MDIELVSVGIRERQELVDMQERERTFYEEIEELRKAMRKLGRALLGFKEGEDITAKKLLYRLWPLIVIWLCIVYVAFVFKW
jgi:hypothetical protein